MSKQLQIHFITGKGGVGKSTLAAAMAVDMAQKGLKTLLVDLSEQNFLQNVFKPISVGSYDPVEVSSHLSVSHWKAEDCLKEYALHLIKSPSLYKIFFENPIMQTFIRIAPTLKEIAILGKATSTPRHHGPPMDYDRIVIDAYATGHFLAMIKAPHGLAQTVQVGPMGEQSRGIDQCLRNPEICFYHIVCLPEELPIKEGLELAQNLYNELQVRARLWINKYLDIPETWDLSSESIFIQYLKTQKERQEASLLRLQDSDSFQGPANNKESKVSKLPWVFKSSAAELVQEMAKHL